MIDKVDRMASLTCQGNLSPMIRMRGLQETASINDSNRQFFQPRDIRKVQSLFRGSWQYSNLKRFFINKKIMPTVQITLSKQWSRGIILVTWHVDDHFRKYNS